MITEVHRYELERDPELLTRLADCDRVRILRSDGPTLLMVTEDHARSDAEGAEIAERFARRVSDRRGAGLGSSTEL